jgi:hypothetical protein
MISKSITISIPSGLEARPVALLVQVASRFESKITIDRDNDTIQYFLLQAESIGILYKRIRVRYLRGCTKNHCQLKECHQFIRKRKNR